METEKGGGDLCERRRQVRREAEEELGPEGLQQRIPCVVLEEGLRKTGQTWTEINGAINRERR